MPDCANLELQLDENISPTEFDRTTKRIKFLFRLGKKIVLINFHNIASSDNISVLSIQLISVSTDAHYPQLAEHLKHIAGPLNFGGNQMNTVILGVLNLLDNDVLLVKYEFYLCYYLFMNNEEIVVQKLLKKEYHEQIIFEPDGNMTPDFKIGDHTAVEVRRLNQNYFADSQVEGLEKLSVPIYEAFQEVLHSFGKQKSNFSYYVGLEFERPIDLDIHELKKQITENLQSFLENSVQTYPYILNITNGVELIILKTTSKNKNLFRSAGDRDNDEGGCNISVYIENIQYCINEKSEKIKSYLNKYDEWWLYLVNTMHLIINMSDVKEISNNIQNLGFFDKVKIVSNGEVIFTLDKT